MLRRSLIVVLVAVFALPGPIHRPLNAADDEKDDAASTDDTATKKKGTAASKKSASKKSASKKKGTPNTAAAAASAGSATNGTNAATGGGLNGAAVYGLPGGVQALANAAAVNAAANAAAGTTANTGTTTAAFTADSSTTAGASKSATAGANGQGLAQNLTTLIDLTNQERRKQELQELTVDPLLMKMARDHSANMAKQNIMSHELNGVTFQQRLEQSGYKASMAGENIAAGQPTPADAIAAWMKSPGHRANILNPDFTQIGVGIAQSAAGIFYYTQDFGTPQNALTNTVPDDDSEYGSNSTSSNTSQSTGATNSSGTSNSTKRTTPSTSK
jgi:uncharacterized protein YkwD